MEEIDKAFKDLRNNLQELGKTKTRRLVPERQATKGLRPGTGQVTPGLATRHKGFPKVGVAVQSCLTEDDISRMAELATSERDRLFILLLFYSALRKMECLSLTPTNLLVDESHLKLIQPKTKQSHVVGIPRWLMSQLQAYVTANSIPKSKPIFDLSPYDAWELVKRLARKIGKTAYPHLLRHSRAVCLVKAGLKESEVSRHLGHTSDATVKTYFRFLSEGEVADRVVKLDEKPKII